MNEMLQQFLVESRELADQATEGLLALERTPQDADQLDAVFRAVHTLKGSAGIVDFHAMDRAVHAAEDLLSAARAGKCVLDAAMIGHCLACLDQVLQWLDTIERTGELPQACEAEADRITARFGAALGEDAPASTATAADTAWSRELLARHPGARAQAVTAVRHTPDPECFFHGEDPISQLTALPGLLAFEAGSAAPWPPLASLDPFRCNLVLAALTQASAAETVAHLRGCSGTCEIIPIAPELPGSTTTDLPAEARELLTAQLELVRDGASSRSFGHLASAAQTAANVLRSCGRHDDAEVVARLVAGGPQDMQQPLQAALVNVLALEAPGMQMALAAPEPPAAPLRAETTSRTLRVDAERIDSLVRLTGELTVARNGLAHLASLAFREANPLAAALKARHAAFDHLISEMQRSVLALRVLPLRVVFQRFPRLLREISEALDRPVALKIVGEETEADKAIVEMLFEPLLHVIRNAMDHGIETATLRAGRGKPRAGTIELRAARQGDQVMIEITDDGGGVDVQRVRAVAAQRGVAAPEVLAALSDAQITDLVFAPGFSTAAEVTALSGRGVGMDAVRTAVARIGGRVSIHSVAGRGTTVRFMLPFSVMMTTVMSVEAGGQMFGVPLDTVVETIRVPRSSLAAVGAARAAVVRDQTIPVLDLGQMLGETGSRQDTGDATIVIAAFAGQRCGLEVDALGERLDIILKPLDGLLAGIPGISGTTLLGDGRVLLVLDVAELLQ